MNYLKWVKSILVEMAYGRKSIGLKLQLVEMAVDEMALDKIALDEMTCSRFTNMVIDSQSYFTSKLFHMIDNLHLSKVYECET